MTALLAGICLAITVLCMARGEWDGAAISAGFLLIAVAVDVPQEPRRRA